MFHMSIFSSFYNNESAWSTSEFRQAKDGRPSRIVPLSLLSTAAICRVLFAHCLGIVLFVFFFR